MALAALLRKDQIRDGWKLLFTWHFDQTRYNGKWSVRVRVKVLVVIHLRTIYGETKKTSPLIDTPHRRFTPMSRYSPLASIKYQYQLRVTPELQIYVLKSLRDLLLLFLEFFIENTMGQVISTVEHNRIPLRDLGFEVLRDIDAHHFAYFTLSLSVEQLAAIWILFCFTHGGKGLTTVQKGARCLTIARTLRMFLYTMTILPSPKLSCHFEGPVNPFQLRVGGACNDLLYSGHVTIYTLTGIAFTILSREYSVMALRYGLPTLMWTHILQRILSTILEHHHYSVDMFLGFIVTSLIWYCKPLHIDLPEVPSPLCSHLRQLIFPKSRSTLKEV